MTTIADICVMHLVITAATTAEIQPAIDWLTKKNTTGSFPQADILITGVGAVATTYALAKYLAGTRPNLMIQGGIAGSFLQRNIGTTFVVGQDCFADMGAWENEEFRDLFDLGLAEENQSPFSQRLLANPHASLLSLAALQQVNGITVNEISTDSRRIAWYQQNRSPVVESMEGAAFHYVCLQEKIPFLQLRTVSNYIGERDKTKWKLKEAIDNLNEQIISMVTKLSQIDETYSRV